MSKRAEERASIAAYGWQSDNEGNMTLEMLPEPFRRGFVKGYEQAEKDTIERVCECLEKNVTYTNPQTGKKACIINLNVLRDVMEDE